MIPKYFGAMLLLLWCTSIQSQPTFTANEVVPEYTGQFGYGSNMGLYAGWTDDQLANIGCGNPALGIPGAGVNSLRPLLPEYFLEFFGYTIRQSTFQHYSNLGAPDNVAIIGYPTEAHRDPNEYCEGQAPESFANMYLPIWDDGSDGSPINEDNHYAHYVYRMVEVYKDYVHFWEVLNEPDVDLSGNGWKPRGEPGNWYDNVPDPCEYTFYAPIYLYVRMLKITYEVVKTLDPDAYVCVGGLGNPSFLDLILRHTDNPTDGSVTPEYPLLGGAYFDVLSYHSYPHFDGSLRYYDPNVGGFVYERHSDRAAAGFINKGASFQTVLADYGYGTQYPNKQVICTETNVGRQTFSFYGAEDFQRNYAIKAAVAAQQTGILQMHLYTMGDEVPENNATSEFQIMGLYESLSDAAPYNVVKNDIAIAYKTVSDALENLTYDPGRTAQLSLPSRVSGAAFVDNQNNYTYVLWATTTVDQSENASAIYSFPTNIATGQMEAKAWDYSETGQLNMVNAQNISLNGAPVFIKAVQVQSLSVYAGADQTICPDESTSITAVASGGTAPYTYAWDQNLGAGATHNVSPETTTTYTVTVTDAVGNTVTDAVQIIVEESCTGGLGDFVFEDQNNNGIQDAGEPGINGVSITLSGNDNQGNPVNLNTSSSGNGNYAFSDLQPGTYQLSFQIPTGFTAATANAGGNDQADSDIDQNGNISNITVVAGITDNSLDAGFVAEEAPTGLVITCPDDIIVNVAPNENGANVSWDLPTGTTDCPWGSIGFVQIQGPPSGSFFAINTTTTIQYYAYDGCSNDAVCSFIVTVSDQQDCEVQQGNPCDDGDACTENDVYDDSCNCAGTLIDGDNDGVCDINDNCPDTANPNQEDVDGDGIGDACDDCNILPGTPCDDGDICTENDVYDNNCNCAGTYADNDNDGVCNAEDNCPDTANPNQEDADNNGVGDACEGCAFAPGTPCDDGDICTENDVYDANCNCAGTYADNDNDGVCNAEDNCPDTPNPNQEDADNNGVGDACEVVEEGLVITCPVDIIVNVAPNENGANVSWDLPTGVTDCPWGSIGFVQIQGPPSGSFFAINTSTTIQYYAYDGCSNDAVCSFTVTVSDQQDCEAQQGNPCDDGDACTENDVYDDSCNCAGTLIDGDNDGVCDINDNCPDTANPNQEDIDGDGIGDACDDCNILPGTPCDDGDACTENDVYDNNCNCAGTYADNDNDGVCNAEDNCPDTANPDQTDTDNNGVGDACEGCAFAPGTPCDDGDVCTENDVYDANCNCAGTYADNDNDSVCNAEDNCPDTPNPNQEDADNNGVGDACEVVEEGLVITCPNNISLTVAAGDGGATVSWDEPTGISDCPWGSIGIIQIQGSANGSFFPTGVSNISYYAYDGCSNEAFCNFTITITEVAGLQSDNQTPQEEKLGNSLSQASNYDFNIFPNPATEQAYLDLSNFQGKDIEILIVNTNGQQLRLISLDHVQEGTHELDLKQFENGLYSVVIKGKEFAPVAKRLVVLRQY
jgi:hypothetical protein